MVIGNNITLLSLDVGSPASPAGPCTPGERRLTGCRGSTLESVSPTGVSTAWPAAALLLVVPRLLLATVSQMTNGTSQYSAEGENGRMDKDVTSLLHFTLHSPMTNPPLLSLSLHSTAVNTQRLAWAGSSGQRGRLSSRPLGRPHVSLKRPLHPPPSDPLNSAQRGALIVTGGIGDTRRGEPMN